MKVLAAIIIIFVVGLIILIQKRKTGPSDYPYQKAGSLFSSAERSFFGILNQVVGKDIRVLGKIRVADVIVPKKGLSRSDWQKAFNKISGKHFDFLLCKDSDLSIICAIELNDSSHQSSKRQLRDEFLTGICDAAGIPLIQVAVQPRYLIDDVKKLLAPHLERGNSK